ncbi:MULTISPECIES: hypothetical protein [Acinetobacter calcoaceticus/baumannii complex]|nr:MULTISPECIES: hypothetical protein [Acinetobacter calcoaceticus/baumannii complex]MDQ8847818.1 hypothetical protein [Acinetobacter nosocomialis]UAS49200.1 hypothetical protein K9O37_05805 [Acinetobacter baumannii]
MDKPMTFNEWMGKQGNLALVHANCCRIAYEAGQQSQQAKVEELQTQLSLQRQRVKAFEEELTSSRNYGDELQKRVDAAIKCADLNFWNANTVKAMVEALKGEGQ